MPRFDDKGVSNLLSNLIHLQTIVFTGGRFNLLELISFEVDYD